MLVLILMASEAVVESSENVSDVWRRVTLHAAEVSSLRQSSQGRSGGGAGKGRARRLWFLINGESVSSHDHGFSNSLIIHIENTKEINV